MDKLVMSYRRWFQFSRDGKTGHSLLGTNSLSSSLSMRTYLRPRPLFSVIQHRVLQTCSSQVRSDWERVKVSVAPSRHGGNNYSVSISRRSSLKLRRPG